jgi:enterochelin esterase-like enzyme
MKPFILFMLLTSTAAFAQTRETNNLVSPEVLPDHRVVFRISATNATKVTLFGDWMQTNEVQTMTRDDKGVWSATAGPFAPGLTIYTFTVDGVTTPDPVNPRIKLRARTSASMVYVPGNPPELWEARDVPHGTVNVIWAKSEITGDTRAYYVYTPPGYEASGSKRYPVLYLLHGSNDTAAGWTDVGKANFILDNLIAENKAVPMIIVMPWGHAVPFNGPQSYNTAVFESYLLKEVMPQVEKKYRVAAGRENRAIAGLSMGGGQSLEIGFGHLDLFSAVGAFSSGVATNFEGRFKAELDDSKGTNTKLKLLWIGCGRQDPVFERNQKFAELLTTHNIKNTFYPMEGMHQFAVWRRCFAELAPQLFQKNGNAN